MKKIISIILFSVLIIFNCTIVSAITGAKTTKPLPKNIDGNQGISVLLSTITESDLNSSFSVKVSKFTNNMNCVNLAVYIENDCISLLMNMKSGDKLLFNTPSNIKGKTLKIVMSTNSENEGTCNLKVNKL